MSLESSPGGCAGVEEPDDQNPEMLDWEIVAARQVRRWLSLSDFVEDIR
jgi:hypothetical protein